jgi:hypothetical protein
MRFAICAVLVAVLLAATPTVGGQEPGWSGAVLPIDPEAQQIRQQPILERPNRPGHVYGNTVRRIYYRGNPLPLPRDFAGATVVMFGRR